MDNRESDLINKYYTPEIESFHFGFEYEYLTNGDEWINHIVTNKADLLDCIEDLKENKIRVKYLDKEDIEELGWIQTDYSENTYTLETKHLIWSIDKSFTQYRIEQTSKIIKQLRNLPCFIGKIKNKNELKKLMQQLNII